MLQISFAALVALWFSSNSPAKPEADALVEPTKPAASVPASVKSGGLSGQRRFAPLLSPDLDVIGMLKLAPDVSLSLNFPGNRIPTNYPVTISANIAHLSQAELKKVEFLDGETVIHTITDPSAPLDYTRTWLSSHIGTHQFRVRVTDTDDKPTESVPVAIDIYRTEIKGQVEGIVGLVTNRTIEGWACSTGFTGPTNLLLYFVNEGQPDDVANRVIVGTYSTNLSSDASIASLCLTSGTSAAHRFSIPVDSQWYATHSNKKLGVSASSPAQIPVGILQGSNQFSINLRPTVSSFQLGPPKYGSSYVVDESVALSASASDDANDGDAGIARVEFLSSGSWICGTDFLTPTNSASATCTWRLPGSANFSARAIDSRSVSSALASASASAVSPTPTLQSGTVIDSATYRVSVAGSNFLNSVEVSAHASATGPAIATYTGAQLQRTESGGVTTLTLTLGSQAEKQAFDGAGVFLRVTNLTPGLVTGERWTSNNSVTASANNAPSVSLVSPSAGTSFQHGDVVSLEALASDDAGLRWVRFERLVNGFWVQINTDNNAPYVAAWKVADYDPTGLLQIRAVAMDTNDVPTTSSAISITITARSTPSAPPPPPPVDVVSDAVGATAGEFRVDEAGAATYRIPIYASPGRAGVAPQIALAYSSQAGVGPLGKGWSIAGTSSIVRCRATTESGDPESAWGPVDLSANDRFCLDGQRLLEIAAPSEAGCPAVGSLTVREFRTEIESFQRVCAYTFDPSKGPRVFTVERKDGSKSWYGDRRSASVAADGGIADGYEATSNGAIYAWAQTRLQDSAGNYMDFGYRKGATAGVDLGEHLLSRVDYTGKLNSAGAVVSGTFASIEFGYESTRVGMRYFAGEALYGNQRLDTITVRNSSDGVLRRYDTSYGSAASGEDRLLSVQECRPKVGSSDVCLPATTFAWSTAKYDFSSPIKIGDFQHGDPSKYEGHKLADIDGDGRQDLLWMKDDDSDGICAGERLHVLLARLTSEGQVSFAPILKNGTSDSHCIADELPEDPSSGWFLLDYDGDGREDLFLRSPSLGRWKGHRATGAVNGVAGAFDFANDLLGEAVIPASAFKNKPWDQPQLADFNGDGLMDIVYPKFANGVTFHARLMERDASGVFAWGTERTLDLFGDGQTPCSNAQNPSTCSYKVLGLYRRLNYQQLTDFDADGRSDLLLEIEPTSACASGGPLPGPGDPWVPEETASRGGTASCPSQIYPYVVKDVLATAINARLYGPNQVFFTSVYDPYNTSSYFRATLADINGDGLSDAVFTGGPTSHPVVRMNTGAAFDLPLAQPDSEAANPTHVQVTDLNGDGRVDLAYPYYVAPTNPAQGDAHKYFVVRYGLPTGGFGARTSLAANRLVTGCIDGTAVGMLQCLDRQSFMFGDYDADGAVDFLRIEWKQGGDSPLHLARATNVGKPRDVIEKVTNGLGAVANLTYLPMTNKAVYRRLTGSRNAPRPAGIADHGSPMADLLAPMYLVARAEGSAPTEADPSALARVDYRYVGLRVQAGGRGSLGFDQIHSIDATEAAHHVVTTTQYGYQFPYIGHPLATSKAVVTGDYAEDECFATLAEGCYLAADVAAAGFGNDGGIVVSQSNSEWENAYTANAVTSSAPRPRHVRLASSTDQTYDLAMGNLLTRVVNTFRDYNALNQPISAYDAYGNLKKSKTQTFGASGAALYSVTTENTYYRQSGEMAPRPAHDEYRHASTAERHESEHSGLGAASDRLHLRLGHRSADHGRDAAWNRFRKPAQVPCAE